MKYFINWFRSSILIVCLFTFFSCDETVTNTDEENSEFGRIRFIHSASSTAELDITYRDLDDNYFYAFEYETKYGHQYGYYDFLTGDRDIKVFLSLTSIAVAEADFMMSIDERLTAIAFDFEATINPELLVLSDTLAVPDSGKPLFDLSTPEQMSL